MNSENPTSSSGPNDEVYDNDECPEKKEWLEYIRKNPQAKYQPLTLEHFFTQAKIIAEQMGTGWYSSGRGGSDEEKTENKDSDQEDSGAQPEIQAPEPKNGPTRKLKLEKWKKKFLKNQVDPGSDEIKTFPGQFIAVTRSKGCTNFINFRIQNTSNRPIKYSAELKNPFLEVVENSDGVMDAGNLATVPIVCKFESNAPVHDELVLKFENSEKCWTKKIPIFYDRKFWS
ncbi:hypothetical protein L5515_005425 [Caenorhabditis briggsae]|uniref:Major sperm protein n=1 Tax=Caenorhabditis briggsae TaxID=6238 RepID=A0AAE9JD94_CAEBR|nr:hypothetical protein L5515_005425 [Caenorhabditis briggsae]